MLMYGDAIVCSLVTCRGFTVLLPKTDWLYWDKNYIRMSLLVKIMKMQNLQSISECNRLWQGSEIASQIVGSISRRVSVWRIARELFWDHFVYSSGVGKNQKSTSTLHMQMYKQAHKIQPTSYSCWFHWETAGDSGAFCKCRNTTCISCYSGGVFLQSFQPFPLL